MARRSSRGIAALRAARRIEAGRRLDDEMKVGERDAPIGDDDRAPQPDRKDDGRADAEGGS